MVSLGGQVRYASSEKQKRKLWARHFRVVVGGARKAAPRRKAKGRSGAGQYKAAKALAFSASTIGSRSAVQKRTDLVAKRRGLFADTDPKPMNTGYYGGRQGLADFAYQQEIGRRALPPPRSPLGQAASFRNSADWKPSEELAKRYYARHLALAAMGRRPLLKSARLGRGGVGKSKSKSPPRQSWPPGWPVASKKSPPRRSPSKPVPSPGKKQWLEAEDQSGKKYYYTSAGERSWDPPPLPAGWQEVIDEHGRTYFWNTDTDTVTWTRSDVY